MKFWRRRRNCWNLKRAGKCSSNKTLIWTPIVIINIHSSDQEGMSEEKIYFFSHQHSIVSEFFQALWFALIANTDVICYLFIFLNTILSMSILALPMSLCVCLWATLTIPRPSKRFWLTVIAYTEVNSVILSNISFLTHFILIESKNLRLKSITSRFLFLMNPPFPFSVPGICAVLFTNNIAFPQDWNHQVECYLQSHLVAFCAVS